MQKAQREKLSYDLYQIATAYPHKYYEDSIEIHCTDGSRFLISLDDPRFPCGRGDLILQYHEGDNLLRTHRIKRIESNKIILDDILMTSPYAGYLGFLQEISMEKIIDHRGAQQ